MTLDITIYSKNIAALKSEWKALKKLVDSEAAFEVRLADKFISEMHFDFSINFLKELSGKVHITRDTKKSKNVEGFYTILNSIKELNSKFTKNLYEAYEDLCKYYDDIPKPNKSSTVASEKLEQFYKEFLVNKEFWQGILPLEYETSPSKKYSHTPLKLKYKMEGRVYPKLPYLKKPTQKLSKIALEAKDEKMLSLLLNAVDGKIKDDYKKKLLSYSFELSGKNGKDIGYTQFLLDTKEASYTAEEVIESLVFTEIHMRGKETKSKSAADYQKLVNYFTKLKNLEFIQKEKTEGKTIETFIGVYLRKVGNELQRAIEAADIKRVEELLKLGIEVNKTDEDGKTPLHYACEQGSEEITKLLIASGAKIDIRFDYTSLLKMLKNSKLSETMKQLVSVIHMVDIVLDYISKDKDLASMDFKVRSCNSFCVLIETMEDETALELLPGLRGLKKHVHKDIVAYKVFNKDLESVEQNMDLNEIITGHIVSLQAPSSASSTPTKVEPKFSNPTPTESQKVKKFAIDVNKTEFNKYKEATAESKAQIVADFAKQHNLGVLDAYNLFLTTAIIQEEVEAVKGLIEQASKLDGYKEYNIFVHKDSTNINPIFVSLESNNPEILDYIAEHIKAANFTRKLLPKDDEGILTSLTLYSTPPCLGIGNPECLKQFIFPLYEKEPIKDLAEPLGLIGLSSDSDTDEYLEV